MKTANDAAAGGFFERFGSVRPIQCADRCFVIHKFLV
jgi:hypothetical protein